MIKNILLILVFAFTVMTHTNSAFALIAGPAKVIGTVKSFDEKYVLVENEESKYKIPKDYVAGKNLRAGNKIEITLSQEQVDKIKIEKKKATKK